MAPASTSYPTSVPTLNFFSPKAFSFLPASISNKTLLFKQCVLLVLNSSLGLLVLSPFLSLFSSHTPHPHHYHLSSLMASLSLDSSKSLSLYYLFHIFNKKLFLNYTLLAMSSFSSKTICLIYIAKQRSLLVAESHQFCEVWFRAQLLSLLTDFSKVGWFFIQRTRCFEMVLCGLLIWFLQVMMGQRMAMENRNDG